MAGIGISEALIFVVVATLWAIPFWRMLPRTGLPAWMTLLAFIPVVGPLVGLALVWVMAFRAWPCDDPSGRF